MKTNAQNMALRLHQSNVLRAIAVFEVIKGSAAIIASLALLNLMHQNVRHITSLFINYLHLDSDAHYFKTFFEYTDLLNNEDLHTTILLAWVYAAIRFF